MSKIDRFVYEKIPDRDLWPTFINTMPLPESLNIVESLFEHKNADHVFIQTNAKTWTYGDIYQRVCQLSQVYIENYALVVGNRVLLRGGNTLWMAVAWLAVVRAGLIAVATMPLLRAKELTDVIEQSQPQLFVCDDSLMNEAKIAVASYPHLPLVPFVKESEDSIDAQLCKKSGHIQAAQTNPHDIAMIAFTSGTTGVPKAPVHTHYQILQACHAWPIHVLQQTSNDRIIGTPPLAFTFGLGGLLLFPMIAGASIYYPDVPLNPEKMLQLIEEHQLSICYTSPTFYQQMLNHVGCYDIRSLRICVSAGEPLSNILRQQWQEKTKIKILDGIGSTEMFHIFISAAGTEIRENAIGKPVFGYEAKIVDEQGHEVPRNTVGFLVVRGPTGCCYLNNPEQQRKYVKDGWNYPGDHFMEDEDGYFYFQSRSDDMIVSSGYNISAIEVEAAINQHPDVRESAVVGCPDVARGHIVQAFIVLEEAHDGMSDYAKTEKVKEIQDFVKKTIAPFKYPRKIVFWSTLPKTPSGKLQRFHLKKQVLEES